MITFILSVTSIVFILMILSNSLSAEKLLFAFIIYCLLTTWISYKIGNKEWDKYECVIYKGQETYVVLGIEITKAKCMKYVHKDF